MPKALAMLVFGRMARPGEVEAVRNDDELDGQGATTVAWKIPKLQAVILIQQFQCCSSSSLVLCPTRHQVYNSWVTCLYLYLY